MDISELRGHGRWEEALELTMDPLARAELLNEQALFTGSAEAREDATRELVRAEARLLQERGRVLHAAFLSERTSVSPGTRTDAAMPAFRRSRSPWSCAVATDSCRA